MLRENGGLPITLRVAVYAGPACKRVRQVRCGTRSSRPDRAASKSNGSQTGSATPWLDAAVASLSAVAALAGRRAGGGIRLAVLHAAAPLAVERAASAVVAFLHAAPFFAVHDALDPCSVALLVATALRCLRATDDARRVGGCAAASQVVAARRHRAAGATRAVVPSKAADPEVSAGSAAACACPEATRWRRRRRGSRHRSRPTMRRR